MNRPKWRSPMHFAESARDGDALPYSDLGIPGELTDHELEAVESVLADRGLELFGDRAGLCARRFEP